jgi:hypothetical protein
MIVQLAGISFFCFKRRKEKKKSRGVRLRQWLVEPLPGQLLRMAPMPSC